MNILDGFRKIPQILVLVPLLAAFGGVYVFLPLSTFVRGVFLLIGFLLSLIVFYLTSDLDEWPANTVHSSWTHAKIVTFLAMLPIIAQVQFNTRVAALAVFLPVSYLIVAYQIGAGSEPLVVLYELSLIYAIPLFTKFLATGVYFGGGDVFRHLVFVDQMLSAGDFNNIASNYWVYPIFHLMIGSVKVIFGVQIYDAIVLSGITVYTLMIPVLYLTTMALSGDQRIGLGVAIGFTIMVLPKYYTLYFFPQSLAIAMLFVGVYLYSRLFTLPSTADKRRYIGLIAGLAVLMAMTHHLTFVLMGIPISILLAFMLGREVIKAGGVRDALSRSSNSRELYAFPILITLVIFFTYWLYSPSIFLTRVIGALITFIAETTSGGFTVASYGLTPLTGTVRLSISWLLSADGVYYTLFSSILFTGFYEVVRNWKHYWSWLPVVITGLVLGGLLLPLPFPIPWFNRIRLVLIIFTVFALGVGVARVCRVNALNRRSAFVSLILIASVGTMGVFTYSLASDVDSMHTDKHRAEYQFEEREYQMIQSLATFLDTRATTTVSASPDSEAALSAEGYSQAETGIEPRNNGIEAPNGLLFVREKWIDHKQVLVHGEFIVSESRFTTTMARHNKIYTTGETHLLWNDDSFQNVFEPQNESMNAM